MQEIFSTNLWLAVAIICFMIVVFLLSRPVECPECGSLNTEWLPDYRKYNYKDCYHGFGKE